MKACLLAIVVAMTTSTAFAQWNSQSDSGTGRHCTTTCSGNTCYTTCY